MTFIRRFARDRKGAALVEYGLLIAGVSLIGAAAVSTFGHKTNDMLASVAAILPGAHADDNGPIFSGKLIETTQGANGIALDAARIASEELTGVARLGENLLGAGGGDTLALLVVEAEEEE